MGLCAVVMDRAAKDIGQIHTNKSASCSKLLALRGVVRRISRKKALFNTLIFRAQNLWYFGSKCYLVFSFATGILMW